MPESAYKHTSPRHAIIYLSFIFILFLLTFYPGIKAVLLHGITWHLFIPLISGYIIWVNRRSIFCEELKSNLSAGAIFIIAGIFILFAGNVTSTLVISEISIVIALWGLTICIGGFGLLKKLLWPLLYLLFISSGTEGLFDHLTPLFRDVSALLATLFAKLLGFSILLSETYIRLPYMVLNVADECSGINHLISLTAITLPLAFLSQRKKWAIGLLIIAAFPVALFSNSLRVLIIIIFNYNRHIFTHGPNNIFVTGSGFFIGLAFIFLLSAVLSKFTGSTLSDKTVKTGDKHLFNYFKISRNQIIILSAILFCGFLFISLWKIRTDLKAPDFSTLSSVSSEWTPHFTNSIPVIDSFPSADNEFSIAFNNAAGLQINLYIGWYSQQTQGREVAGSRYDQFLKHTGNLLIKTGNYPPYYLSVCQNRNIETGTVYLVAYYTNRRITDKPMFTKIYTVFDALLRRSTSASIIIFTLPGDNLSDRSVSDNIKPLIGKILSTIDHLQ